MKDRIWCTTDEDFTQYCKFFIMYQGGVSFTDTITGNWNLPSPPPMLLTLDDDEQVEAVNLVGQKSAVQGLNVQPMLPLYMRNIKMEKYQKSMNQNLKSKTDYQQKVGFACVISDHE